MSRVKTEILREQILRYQRKAEECQLRLEQLEEPRICEYCGVSFQRIHESQKYCNRDCQQKAGTKMYQESLARDIVKLEKRRQYLRLAKRKERARKRQLCKLI